MLAATGHRGSRTFWIAMTILNAIGIVVFAILAYQAKVSGRTDRQKRFMTAVYGFAAVGSLALARVVVLS